ncbi:hypothetical protein SK236_14680 [Pseudomonas aeruginosa]|nr:hypothetical protein [Pseudomonas aeruginosa]MDX8067427.1 hypothetical protein [Pseudomonas aeruginosa]MDX8097205.1 hypothetical protein [Pseudomonas aeruginosa]
MCVKRRRVRKGRPRQPAPKTLPDDLYDYDDDPAPRISPPRGSPPDAFDVEKLPVIDDWPENVPITEAEIQVFERWFSDVFDEMFGPLPPVPGLKKLSSSDNKKP